jgi:hypothetical protein
MSATEATGATGAINATTKPRCFFSLPRELRDHIYDILHRYEAEAELAQLAFRFRRPPVHLQLINRRFTTELDMRPPVTDHAHLVVSQRPTNPIWYPDEQPLCLPEIPTRMHNTRFTHLEFQFDVRDGYREIYTEMLYFHEYSLWVGSLLEHDPRLVSSSCGGELYLQLSFRHVSNLELLIDLISHLHWYDSHCTKISMVLLGVHKRTPTMETLGLHIYSDMPQTLAVWDKLSGWEVEKVVYKHARIERLSNLDPFEPSEIGADVEIDWVAFEGGDYFAENGSGWDIGESVVEQSRAEWKGGEEGFSVDGGV